MKQFMESSVPDTVLESARLDGASEFRTFLIIAMPMVKPAWLTLMIESFKGLWNSGASIYIHSEELKTFNYAINQIITGGIARSGAGAAAIVIMMIVPIAVFVLNQSQIIETMGSSGMKD
jgi:ABC-type glycerol-3-phosphate transport system permease component